jgi:hypothetical protein
LLGFFMVAALFVDAPASMLAAAVPASWLLLGAIPPSVLRLLMRFSGGTRDATWIAALRCVPCDTAQVAAADGCSPFL